MMYILKEEKEEQELEWSYEPSKEFGLHPDTVGPKQYRVC